MARNLKKKKNFSWDKTEKRLRKIVFKALKKGDKLGLELGLEDECLEVVAVRENSEAYWKGIEKGYKIVSVNKVAVSVDTVKSALRNACDRGNDFSIEMHVPLSEDVKVDVEQENHLASSSPGEFVVHLRYNLPDDSSEIKNNIEMQVPSSSPGEFVVHLRYNLPDDSSEIKNNINNRSEIFENGSIAENQVNDFANNKNLVSSRPKKFVVNLRYNLPDHYNEIKNNMYNRAVIFENGSIAEKKVNDAANNNNLVSSRPKEVVVNLCYHFPNSDMEIKNNILNKQPIFDIGSISKKQVNVTNFSSGVNDGGKPSVSLRELGIRA